MANWEKDGVPFRNPLVVDGTQIFNPTAEQLRNAGYEQVVRTPPKGSTVFTKLQIRRALRALGQEAVLDTALAKLVRAGRSVALVGLDGECRRVITRIVTPGMPREVA